MASPFISTINLKLTLAYEGTSYLGWQKTKMGPSIEEALEKALFQIFRIPILLQAASRTDAGVHAEGQIVNFTLPYIPNLFQLRLGLNSFLPDDISILSLENVETSFHPTLDALGKEYHYHIYNHSADHPLHRKFSWHVPHPLNLEAMRNAANYLIGEHDFSAFSNEPVAHAIRKITSIEISLLSEKRIRIAVKGNHFLYKMVRNIVGTLVYVGCGKISIDKIPAILASRDRKSAGITAPAHGLTLFQVFYHCPQQLS
jgi:tRNA pseudouridine38-40 synthase